MKPRWIMLALVGAVALAGIGWALSGGAKTRRDYASFAQCPLGDPATDLCLFTRAEHGEFRVGERKMPIGDTITLQGGAHVVEDGRGDILRDDLIAAEDGKTLSRTPQPFPGGLRGVVDADLLSPSSRRAFDELLARGISAVTATIELVAPASSIHMNVQNLIEGRGIALSMPVQMRLSNPFLGADCHIGSARRPVVLALTTGTTSPPGPNRPIEGRIGKAKLSDDYNLTVIRGTALVGNAFAGPPAGGCGAKPSPQIDRAVNAALGLPAPAGENAAVLEGTLQDANASAVRASR